MWFIWTLIALAILFVTAFTSYFNKIVRFENRIDNSWQQIDVQLKKRADLVPNLVETVKGYAKHEKKIMEEVSTARERMVNAGTFDEKVKAGNVLGNALRSVFAIAENYPTLKANENFKQLQEELSAIENKIAYARQHYNDSVLVFNNTIETFPGNIFAGFMNKKERKGLEITTAERELPKVSF